MATLTMGRVDVGNAQVLGTAQTGNGATTNIINRGKSTAGGLLEFVTTVAGGSETVTLALEVSNDGTNFWAAPYSLLATPATVVVAAPAAITTATTTRFILAPGYPWKYLRVTRSANTGVTITSTAYLY